MVIEPSLEVSQVMGVPPNHPILIGFSFINHPFWGTPHDLGNLYIYQYLPSKSTHKHGDFIHVYATYTCKMWVDSTVLPWSMLRADPHQIIRQSPDEVIPKVSQG